MYICIYVCTYIHICIYSVGCNEQSPDHPNPQPRKALRIITLQRNERKFEFERPLQMLPGSGAGGLVRSCSCNTQRKPTKTGSRPPPLLLHDREDALRTLCLDVM